MRAGANRQHKPCSGERDQTALTAGIFGRQRHWAQFSYVARHLPDLLAALVADASVAPGATVVDYGCGHQPYRPLFDGCEYMAVDLPDNLSAAVHIDADGRVPLPDESADLVFSSQVLEHVPNPEMYLAECHRMLRPGGTLVLSTHGVMFLHRHPTDYWRWTCDGLRLIVERAGFAVAEQRGLMTLSAAGLQLIQHHYLMKARGTIQRVVIGSVFQTLIAYADRRGSEDERRQNGFVLAIRGMKPRSV